MLQLLPVLTLSPCLCAAGGAGGGGGALHPEGVQQLRPGTVLCVDRLSPLSPNDIRVRPYVATHNVIQRLPQISVTWTTEED